MPGIFTRTVLRSAALTALFCSGIVSAQAPSAGQPIRAQPLPADRIVAQKTGELPRDLEALRREEGVSIYGIVQNHLGQLVPNAGVVHVRSLLTGRIVASVNVDNLAQFALRGLEPGVYVAELVDRRGNIIATSNAFAGNAGQILQLAPVVPVAPRGGLASLLYTMTLSTVSGAAASGVFAVQRGVPVSPR